MNPDAVDAATSRPYPFFLAYQLDVALEELGPASAWQAEWKWDGIRAQIIRRAGEVWIWSRGEELLRGRFPVLEREGADLRPQPLAERRARLETLLGSGKGEGRLLLSPRIEAADWAGLEAARQTSRERAAEGVMLKRLDS